MCKTQREYLAVCRVVGLTNVQIEFGGKHFVVRSAEGVIFAPCTPSDHRNMKNFRAQARRIKRKNESGV